MDETIAREQIDELASAMLELRSVEEARCFFEDLLTISEMQAIAQRLAVARLLREKTTYQEIAERTGASTATISRVNRALLYGAGGYMNVLSRLDETARMNGQRKNEDIKEEKR